MRFKIIYRLIFFLLITLFLSPTLQAFELLDGKVVVHGKVSEQLLMRARNTMSDEIHDYDFFNARSSIMLEVMAHLWEGDGFQELNLYSVWRNYYDAAHEFDSGYKNYLRDFAGNSSHAIEELKSYEKFRDICRELYLEYTTDSFQIRVGKQIISWGDMGFERMADIVNPIDMRGMLNPAYPEWAELKRGLWMVRLYLTPSKMPMDMKFEFLIIPEFLPDRNWPAGYHLSHPPSMNGMVNPNELYLADYRDRPRNWDNPELGFRVRGFFAGFDWTLQWLHHRSDQAVFKTNKAVAGQLPAFFGGRAEDVKDFRWYNTFGLTFNKTVDKVIPIIPGTTLAMSGNVLSLEAIYDLNKDCTQVVGFNSNVKEYDRFACAVGWTTKIFVPKLTPWNRNEYLNSTTQIFVEWVDENRENYYIYPYLTYRKGGHHWSMITQLLNMEFWNSRIIPAVYAAYYITQGGGYWAPALAFKPQFHWTFMLRYLNYFDLYHGVNDKDFFTFEITYEF